MARLPTVLICSLSLLGCAAPSGAPRHAAAGDAGPPLDDGDVGSASEALRFDPGGSGEYDPPLADPEDDFVPPRNLQFLQRTGTRFILDFQCGFGTAYSAYRRIDGGTWQRIRYGIGPTSTGSSHCRFSERPPSDRSELCYRVRGVRGSDASWSNTVCSPSPPNPPSLEVVVYTSDSIRLDYRDNSRIETGYRIERRTGETGTWQLLATEPASAGVGPRQWVDDGLADDTLYEYRVHALGDDGLWSYRAQGSAFLQEGPAPEDQDCSVRERYARDPDWSGCHRASEYTGCITPEQAHGCLVLDADATFCASGEVFDTTVYLTDSGTSLDCNGQLLAHPGRDSGRSAIRAPYTYSVSDISIANCRIADTGHYGIDLKRFFRNMQLDGSMRGHERIRIENVQIDDPDNSGIYVGHNSRQITLRHVTIRNAALGVYLEAGTWSAHLDDVTITGTRDREAIALDSSQHDVIENSHFDDNPHGGIYLYKNCGETNGQVCPIRRPLFASYNTIRNNDFRGGSDVVVASRQFRRYTLFGSCIGIDYYGYWRDHADYNSIYGNHFHDGTKLDVQDSDNAVWDNEFDGSLFEIGSGDPIGDDPIHYAGYIADNTFDDESWLGVQGSPSRVFTDEMTLDDNHLADGSCLTEYERRVSCGSSLIGRWSEFGCYSYPIDIPSELSCVPIFTAVATFGSFSASP